MILELHPKIVANSTFTPEGCYIFGGKSPTIFADGKSEAASTLAWEAYYGEKPVGRIYRTCKTKNCLNKDHLRQSPVAKLRASDGEGGLPVEARVEKRTGGCWHWLGAFTDDLPVYNMSKKSYRPYRLLYETYIGPLNHKRMVKDCPNPLCVSPYHYRVDFSMGDIGRGSGIQRSLEDRFWSKVNKIDDDTSCWEWTGRTVGKGDPYGSITLTIPVR